MYQIPQHISQDKIFIVKKSEIEGRLEPNFYRPSIATLEKKIRSLSSKRLRSYAQSFAGGATPSKREYEKYYSESETGIPFLRVQNLQTNGELSLNECIYINEETHNGLLKRSQVSEGDLLVKITGVGRMAIASVAPKDFVGNTNQHMVVIKTGNSAVSKYLARYLNLDIIEKIASRHSTGGTRPALDYHSLKNIPIIEGLDFSIIDNAIKAKKAKEVEAQQLLDSIDGYLLKELGITIPSVDDGLKNRIFLSSFSKIEGNRIDPKYNKQIRYFQESYDSDTWKTLSSVSIVKGQYGANEAAIEFQEGDTRYIRITDIDEIGNLKNEDKKTAQHIDDMYLLHNGDILFARSGSVGKCYLHRDVNPSIFAGYLIRFVLNKNVILPEFLFYYCNSSIYWYWVDTIHRPAVQANINAEEYCKMPIPVPSINKQQEIVNYIADIRTRAKALQAEGKAILEDAKRKVEEMIIGE